jgi:hypothetical protein
MAPSLAPGYLAGLALAVVGLGLLAAAFLADGKAPVRFFGGLGALVLGMLAAGRPRPTTASASPAR